MSKNRISVAIESVKAGGMSFEAFAIATRPEWKRLARHLLSHWSVPDAVEPEDIEQELMLGAWRALNNWRENGAELGVHVVWNAITDAKKWIHSQRAALRRNDRSPSRHPVSLSKLSSRYGTEDRSSVALEPTVEAYQGDRIEAAERLRDLVGALGQADGVCLLAFVSTGSVDGAIAELGANLRMRLALRIGSDDDARRMVRGAVSRAVAIEA